MKLLDTPGRRFGRFPPALVTGLSHELLVQYRDLDGVPTTRSAVLNAIHGKHATAPSHISGVFAYEPGKLRVPLDRIIELADYSFGSGITVRAMPDLIAWAAQVVADHREHHG
jgi:hypothetical protein